jgi:hypothetical protein
VSTWLRASSTNLVNLRANSRMRCSCLSCTPSFGINSPPMPRATAPARTKLKAVCWFTPPEAIHGTCGNGAFSARMKLSPPTCAQGKILTGLLRYDDLRWCQCAGKNDNFVLCCELHDFQNKSGARQEFCSGIQNSALPFLYPKPFPRPRPCQESCVSDRKLLPWLQGQSR